MKTLKYLFFQSWLLLLLVGVSFPAQSQTKEEIIIQNSNIKFLSGRVYAMLNSRIQGVADCDVATQNSFLSEFKTLPKFTEDKNVLERAVSLYYKSYQKSGKCQISLNAAEMRFHSSERKMFVFSAYYKSVRPACNFPLSVEMAYNDVPCADELSQILSDLNPHCISTQVPFDPKFFDSFICMVGDIMIGKFLYGTFPNPKDQLTEIKTFLHSYWNQSHSDNTQGKKTELYDVFGIGKLDDYKTRARFLGVMTFLLASTKSTSPYIKGFQDYIWRRHVLKTGDAKTAVELFLGFRSITDEFKHVNSIILSKKFKITLLNQDVNDLNRHNIMAMFLSCHYVTKSKKVRKGLPLALGYSYEAMDFISHIVKDGDTFKQATENFSQDTNRYDMGVEIGVTFCTF
jgi:hypothetical protein